MTAWDPLLVTMRGGGRSGCIGPKASLGCGLLRCKRWVAKEIRGHGRTSAVGLGPNRKKGLFIFRIYFTVRKQFQENLEIV
jgi:hypothetical protein